MNKSTVTLKDVLFKPSDKQIEQTDGQWNKLATKIKDEIKDIKWTASLPDLTQKAGELLDIKIPDILISSWKKEQAIKKIIKESIASPEEVFYIELVDHTIKSEHHPYIEIVVKGIPPKKIEFLVIVQFNLKGFILNIKNGVIKKIQTGSCEVEGYFKYQDLILAKKNLSSFKLPGIMPLQ